jgi:uncharacterized protein (DUF58 family)
VRILDPVALAKLRSLSLPLRRLVAEGRSSGRHRSRWRGPSHEFAQHRPYAPGDELKTLDWKVFARQDRFYVREYQAEQSLNAMILLDASGSMAFGAKWDVARGLAMAASYLALAEGDEAGLTIFDSRPRETVPARTSFAQLELLDQTVAAASTGGETDLPAVLEQAAARLRRRSLVVVVSDLLGDAERVLSVARAFKARRHELLVLQVLDPAEISFPYDGNVLFEGLEGGELFCDAASVGELYRSEMARRLRLYEASFHRSDVVYGLFTTDRPWVEQLARLLAR